MEPEGPAERAAETVRTARAALPKGSLNLARIDAHRTDTPRAHTRTSRCAALRPADLTSTGRSGKVRNDLRGAADQPWETVSAENATLAPSVLLPEADWL